MTAGKRTIAKPPSYLGKWVIGSHRQPLVEYGPAREDFAGERRFFDVYVDGEYAGWVYRHNYTAERPTHRGSRIVVRGKQDNAVEWLCDTDPRAAPSGYGLGQPTKAAATAYLVDAFYAARRTS